MTNPFQPLSLRQLRDAARVQPTQYLVENLLPIGSLNQIVGKPKSGKSTLARQLAVSVTKGAGFLGRPTLKGDVLYFASEELGSHLDEHFALLGAEEGIRTEAYEK